MKISRRALLTSHDPNMVPGLTKLYMIVARKGGNGPGKIWLIGEGWGKRTENRHNRVSIGMASKPESNIIRTNYLLSSFITATKQVSSSLNELRLSSLRAERRFEIQFERSIIFLSYSVRRNSNCFAGRKRCQREAIAGSSAVVNFIQWTYSRRYRATTACMLMKFCPGDFCIQSSVRRTRRWMVDSVLSATAILSILQYVLRVFLV